MCEMQPLKVYEIYQKTIIIKSTILRLGNKYEIDHQIQEIVKKNDESSLPIKKTIHGKAIDLEFITCYQPLKEYPSLSRTTKTPDLSDMKKYRQFETFNKMVSYEYESQETCANDDIQYSKKLPSIPQYHLKTLTYLLEYDQKDWMKNYLENEF